MKKYSILMGAAFSLFALASCQKEVDVVVTGNESASKHIPFELKAEVPETRTSFDAGTWEMAWENGDVIYAVTTDEEWGEPYSKEDPKLESIAEFINGENGFSTTKRYQTVFILSISCIPEELKSHITVAQVQHSNFMQISLWMLRCPHLI